MAKACLIAWLCMAVSGATGAWAAPPWPEKRRPPAAWGEPEMADAPARWADEEIAAAQRECIAALARERYLLEVLEPIREGLCGAPAPVSLTGLPGREAALRFMPAATLTCDTAARVREWVDRVLQPTATARLGAAVTKIRLMGSYSCRRRYNAPDKRLSQHALANALDIAAFQTSDGQVITVLDHWAGDDERAAFLRDIHTGACQIFDTVLGPRANEAHANHFHFDIGSGGICE